VDALSVLRVKHREMPAARATASSHFVCPLPSRARVFLPQKLAEDVFAGVLSAERGRNAVTLIKLPSRLVPANGDFVMDAPESFASCCTEIALSGTMPPVKHCEVTAKEPSCRRLGLGSGKHSMQAKKRRQ